MFPVTNLKKIICKEYHSLFQAFTESLTLKSDEHLISPYSITPESNMKVIRIREMITN